jgi:23S rRNA A2030 N6-methylase RlmJ
MDKEARRLTRAATPVWYSLPERSELRWCAHDIEKVQFNKHLFNFEITIATLAFAANPTLAACVAANTRATFNTNSNFLL